jgi:hypothetical protein
MINLELTIQETNLVLEALGALPYARVYELINNIHRQAQAQAEDRTMAGVTTGATTGATTGVTATEGSAE